MNICAHSRRPTDTHCAVSVPTTSRAEDTQIRSSRALSRWGRNTTPRSVSTLPLDAARRIARGVRALQYMHQAASSGENALRTQLCVQFVSPAYGRI